MQVLGHSLVRSLVRSHRSLVCLFRTARFARALRCAHSFTRLFAHFAYSLARGKEVLLYEMKASRRLYTFSTQCGLTLEGVELASDSGVEREVSHQVHVFFHVIQSHVFVHAPGHQVHRVEAKHLPADEQREEQQEVGRG